MNDDLLKRLREPCFERGLDEIWIDDQRNEAADRIEAMQEEIKVMVDGLVVSQSLLEAYSRQKYPSDNPTHKRYRKCDYDANPARMALALINKDTNPE